MTQSIRFRGETLLKVLFLAACSLLISLACLGMTSSQAYAADIEVNGTTAKVYNSSGLKSALGNTNIDTIEFANDIAVVNSADKKLTIAPNRASSKLVVDGKGFAFTEWYVSTYSSSVGIMVTSSGSLNDITFKNMNIVGGNAYGTIQVSKAGITQNFENVTYVGPQLVKNPKGAVNIKDCSITLAKAQGKGKSVRSVAEATTATLAGKVDIMSTGDGCGSDVMFDICQSGGGVYVLDGAQVAVDNKAPKCAGFVGGCTHDVIIGNNASFNYVGYQAFDKGCALRTFAIGSSSQVGITINGKLCGNIINACNTASVGTNSELTILVNGDSCGAVLHAKCGIDLAEGSVVDIDIAGKNGCVAIYSACGNININASAKMTANVAGQLACPIMKVCKSLYVGDSAVLDLIADYNSYGCCNYVFYAGGCNAKLTYDKPERVLFYNGNVSKCGSASAAYLCSGTTIDFDVRSTKYWKKASASGGPSVLTNPTYDWSQGTNYQVKARFGICNTSSFAVTNYLNGKIDPAKYYFSKTYEVCLWETSKREVKLTYEPNDKLINESPVVEQYLEGDSVTISSNPFVSSPWAFVEWSTSPTVGAGTVYNSGSALTITEDTVLYAHWKSRVPTFGSVRTGNTVISGIGIAGSEITVNFPSGKNVITTVAADGKWKVNLPAGDPALLQGEILYANQQEPNKYLSDQASTVVLPRASRAPGELDGSAPGETEDASAGSSSKDHGIEGSAEVKID